MMDGGREGRGERESKSSKLDERGSRVAVDHDHEKDYNSCAGKRCPEEFYPVFCGTE